MSFEEEHRPQSPAEQRLNAVIEAATPNIATEPTDWHCSYRPSIDLLRGFAFNTMRVILHPEDETIVNMTAEEAFHDILRKYSVEAGQTSFPISNHIWPSQEVHWTIYPVRVGFHTEQFRFDNNGMEALETVVTDEIGVAPGPKFTTKQEIVSLDKMLSPNGRFVSLMSGEDIRPFIKDGALMHDIFDVFYNPFDLARNLRERAHEDPTESERLEAWANWLVAQSGPLLYRQCLANSDFFGALYVARQMHELGNAEGRELFAQAAMTYFEDSIFHHLDTLISYQGQGLLYDLQALGFTEESTQLSLRLIEVATLYNGSPNEPLFPQLRMYTIDSAVTVILQAVALDNKVLMQQVIPVLYRLIDFYEIPENAAHDDSLLAQHIEEVREFLSTVDSVHDQSVQVSPELCNLIQRHIVEERINTIAWQLVLHWDLASNLGNSNERNAYDPTYFPVPEEVLANIIEDRARIQDALQGLGVTMTTIPFHEQGEDESNGDFERRLREYLQHFVEYHVDLAAMPLDDPEFMKTIFNTLLVFTTNRFDMEIDLIRAGYISLITQAREQAERLREVARNQLLQNAAGEFDIFI